MDSQEKQVFVLGAGFTKAFLPNAPLMVDDYNGEALAEKFIGFPHASRILDWERSRESDRRINIERLMTRLDSRMPYDFDQGADEELGMLLTEVKKSFMQRLDNARKGEVHSDELRPFAEYCVRNSVNCVTFNYDDVLDEALWKVNRDDRNSDVPHWHPDSGYGFYCKASDSVIKGNSWGEDVATSMLLLKLHGSINWRPRRGYPLPYVVDAIMHHESWFRDTRVFDETLIDLHLEPEPFIVPPVLVKSALVEQPILRLVWHRAYDVLSKARQVTFVGYSFPITDIAVSILFREALPEAPQLPNGPNMINVVNYASNEVEKQQVIDAYRTHFPYIPDERFDFRGALEWSRDLVSEASVSE